MDRNKFQEMIADGKSNLLGKAHKAQALARIQGRQISGKAKATKKQADSLVGIFKTGQANAQRSADYAEQQAQAVLEKGHLLAALEDPYNLAHIQQWATADGSALEFWRRDLQYSDGREINPNLYIAKMLVVRPRAGADLIPFSAVNTMMQLVRQRLYGMKAKTAVDFTLTTNKGWQCAGRIDMSRASYSDVLYWTRINANRLGIDPATVPTDKMLGTKTKDKSIAYSMVGPEWDPPHTRQAAIDEVLSEVGSPVERPGPETNLFAADVTDLGSGSLPPEHGIFSVVGELGPGRVLPTKLRM